MVWGSLWHRARFLCEFSASKLADFAAVLLAASWTGRATLDSADFAASFLGIIHFLFLDYFLL